MQHIAECLACKTEVLWKEEKKFQSGNKHPARTKYFNLVWGTYGAAFGRAPPHQASLLPAAGDRQSSCCLRGLTFVLLAAIVTSAAVAYQRLVGHGSRNPPNPPHFVDFELCQNSRLGSIGPPTSERLRNCLKQITSRASPVFDARNEDIDNTSWLSHDDRARPIVAGHSSGAGRCIPY